MLFLHSPLKISEDFQQENRVFLIAVLFRFWFGFPASFDASAIGWCGVVGLCPVPPSFTDLRCRINAMCVGQELCRDSASAVCEIPVIDNVVKNG